MARFSQRTAWNLAPDSFAEAVASLADAPGLLDLTVSNPTRCGLSYPPGLLDALGDPRALRYDPDPRGLPIAREAVACYYADHGAQVSPSDLILTTSTSEAYSFLFRLLADPGDEVLVAEPGYPLFSFLADLDGVRLVPFTLFPDHGWWIDFFRLETLVTPRTRALILVHPNNPTGHATDDDERARIEEFCARHGLALIVDEVFLDYGLVEPIRSFAQGPHPCLTFVLSGLSKIAALPQMKCGWLVAAGPGREAALARLEVIADTFLSLTAPVQYALPVWLAGRGEQIGPILTRARQNLDTLRAAGIEVLPVQAGWSAVLRLPRIFDTDDAAAWMLAAARVVAHPGHFYKLPHASMAVVSLLTLPATMQEAGVRVSNQIANHTTDR